MAPAIAAMQSRLHSGRIRKRDPRFPARAGRCPADRQVEAPRQASARPGGGEAPAMGGSGAGRGLWPPAGQGTAWRCGRGDGPCHCSGESALVPPGGNRKRDPRFPRPRATVPCRPAGPGTTEGQRPPGAGRILAGGPWLAAGLWHAQRRAGAMASARPREARSEVGPAIRPAAHAAGTFSAACQSRPGAPPCRGQQGRGCGKAVDGNGPRRDRQGPQGPSGVPAARR